MVYAGITVRPAISADTSQIVEIYKSHIETWYDNPLTKTTKTTYEKLTPLQRFLHKGWWLDVNYCKTHLERHTSRNDLVVVAESQSGKLIGEAEVWFDTEPEPFGKYGMVKTLVEHSDYAEMGVQQALLRYIIKSFPAAGYANVDITPSRAGGSFATLRRFEFEPLWDTRILNAKVDNIKPHSGNVKFTVAEVSADYDMEVGNLLALFRNEPPRFLWENIFNSYFLYDATDFFEKFEKWMIKKVEVSIGNIRYRFVTLTKTVAHRAGTAELYLWYPVQYLYNRSVMQETLKISAMQVKELGCEEFIVYIPWFAVKTLTDIGFKGGKERDVCLRKKLAVKERRRK